MEISWEDVSADYDFPEGLSLFHGTKAGNDHFFAYYYEVDMDHEDLAIRPYLSPLLKQVADFSGEVGAYGAINAGFFANVSSVSSVVYPHEVLARNLTQVNRQGKVYPVIRPIFALHSDRSMAAEWVYHHSYQFDDIYIYDAPLPYECDDPDPLPVPSKEDGHPYQHIAYGIGGGPMLIKDGVVNITYCEEIFWGSGVEMTDYRPRTAVGYTPDNKAILFVTNHMKIGDMADLLSDLGCHEAMNLDGGGSTALAAGSESIYDQARAVPTILAVVHSDSLQIPKLPVYEKTMDTSDEGVTSQGSWFASANEGYWESNSMLHELASGDEYFKFPLNLPEEAEYEVYGWWTSHPNRASDTPFIISHADGVSEIAVDQSTGGSMWNHLGTFQFSGSPEEYVRITAAATTNDFVVADGIRIVSYDEVFGSQVIYHIDGVDDITVPTGTPVEEALALLSPETSITDTSHNSYVVGLSWTAEGYDGDVPGDYAALGTFELPEDVEQTIPPTPLEVEANISVEEDDTSIASVNDNKMVVYPNPSPGNFTLEGTFSKPHRVRLTSITGSRLLEFYAEGTFSRKMNLQGHPAGIYFIHISGKERNETLKLILQ